MDGSILLLHSKQYMSNIPTLIDIYKLLQLGAVGEGCCGRILCYWSQHKRLSRHKRLRISALKAAATHNPRKWLDKMEETTPILPLQTKHMPTFLSSQQDAP